METTSGFLRSSTKLLSKLKAERKVEATDMMHGMSPLSWDNKERENTCVVKIEDKNQLYRPLFKQFDDIPKVAYNESGSPFDVGVVLTKQSDNHSTKKKPHSAALRGGYCESCDHWYKCTLKEHLNSNKHKEFVSKLENFKTLEVFSQNLSKFENFLSHHLVQKSEPQKTFNDVCNHNTLNNNNNNKMETDTEGTLVNKSLIGPACKQDKEASLSNCISDNSKENTIPFAGNPTKYFMQKYTSKELSSVDLTEKELVNNSEKSNNEKRSVQSRDSESPSLCTVPYLSKAAANDEHTMTSCQNMKDKPSLKMFDCSSQNSSDTMKGIDKCKVVIPEANFSSSSCSFGDTGVKHALSLLQSNISEVSQGRKSADIFAKLYCKDETRRISTETVIDKSEISFQSKSSDINSCNAHVHEPTLEKFMKVTKDNIDMPELFPIEDLTQSDIRNSAMPIIDKHTPPSHFHKANKNISVVSCSESNNVFDSGSTSNILNLTESTEPYANSCQMPLNVGGNLVESEIENKEASNPKHVERKPHTPTREIGSNLYKDILERVKHSGSTITSVKNWLIPNEDSNSVYSGFSISKMENTLLANPDSANCDNDKKDDVEQIEYSDQQRTLVANWIQNQEFTKVPESQPLEHIFSEVNETANIQSCDQDIKSQDSFGRVNVHTPISEKYENSNFTDLSSIPTDSVISENSSIFTPENEFYSVGKAANEETACKESTHIKGMKDSAEANRTEYIQEDTLDLKNKGNMSLKENTTCSKKEPTGMLTTNTDSQNDIHTVQKNSEGVDHTNSNQERLSERSVSESQHLSNIKDESQTNFGLKSNQMYSGWCSPIQSLDKTIQSPISQSSFKETISNNEKILHAYSPISQSSDYSVQSNDYHSANSVKSKRNKNQSNLLPNENHNQQICYQPSGNQYPQNQAQNYYNTGILPGQNLYSEQRLMYMYHQNTSGFHSQLQGFSGLSDISYGFNSPQQQQQLGYSHIDSSNFQQDIPANVTQNTQYNHDASQDIYSNIHTGDNQTVNQTNHDSRTRNLHAGNSYNIQENNLHAWAQQNNYGVNQNIQTSVYPNNVQSLNMTTSSSSQNVNQNFMYPNQTDYLDNSCLSPNNMTLYENSVGSTLYYPAQSPVFSHNTADHLHSAHGYNQPLHVSQFQQGFSPVGPAQQFTNYQPDSNNMMQFSEGLYCPDALQSVQTHHWYLSSPGYEQSHSEMPGQRRFETISLNDIAEDSSGSSKKSFPLGKRKTRETKQPGKDCKSAKRKTVRKGKANANEAVARDSIQNTSHLAKYNGLNSKVTYGIKEMAASVNNTYSSDNLMNSAESNISNTIPSVQHLKTSSHLAVNDREQGDNNVKMGANEQQNNDRSYMSAKVGDTKLKICKQETTTNEKKTDLKDFWNVRKTGECRLVFRANKRKADTETDESDSRSITPSIENFNCGQTLMHPKKRRCLVYWYFIT